MEGLEGAGGAGNAAEEAELGEGIGGAGIRGREPDVDMPRIGADLLIGMDGAASLEGGPGHLLGELIEASAHGSLRKWGKRGAVYFEIDRWGFGSTIPHGCGQSGLTVVQWPQSWESQLHVPPQSQKPSPAQPHGLPSTQHCALTPAGVQPFGHEFGGHGGSGCVQWTQSASSHANAPPQSHA